MSGTYIEIEIREIQTSDDPRDLPIIVLADKSGTHEFPIFVGHIEAGILEESAVRTTNLLNNHLQRPMTHDLIMNIIQGLSATPTRILITRLESGTFFGAVELETSSGEIALIDSRPSDALILAMKRKIPIYVEEKVLAEVERGNVDNPE